MDPYAGSSESGSVAPPGASTGAAGNNTGSHAGNPPPGVRKSPSLLNMFRGLNPPSKKGAQAAETHQQKRRGPKPDSKPAQTRRQELNRQAQRTHRERKEQYIRSLEVQISQLREGYNDDITNANMTIYQQRQALEEAREENRQLRQLLTSHGISFEAQLERQNAAAAAAAAQTGGQVSPFTESHGQSTGFSSSGHPHSTPGTSISPGRSPGFVSGADASEPPPVPTSLACPYQPEFGTISHHAQNRPYGKDPVGDIQGVFDKDPQLGIDFILSLEDSCRPHMELLCRRAHDDVEQATTAGHILMACCPPPSFVASADRGTGSYNFHTYDLPAPNLNTLLNLSKQIVSKDEITPIMALQTLKTHELYPSFTRDDVARILDDLAAKVRCYGFGAVLEEFEFMDSLSRLVASKTEVVPGGGGSADPPSHEPPETIPPPRPRARDDAMYS